MVVSDGASVSNLERFPRPQRVDVEKDAGDVSVADIVEPASVDFS
jgi:hypothetical protein